MNTTNTPAATNTAGIDLAQLDKLEALANAATPGPWKAIEWTCHAPTTVRAGAVGITVADTTGHGRNSDVCAIDASFIAAANPVTVQQLIALARRSLTSGAPAEPAPSAEQAAKASDARYSQGYSDGWNEGRADLSAGAAAKTEQDAKLQREVAIMYQMLDDGEWAEHIAETPTGQCLETAITKLVDRATAAGAGSAQPEALDECNVCNGKRYLNNEGSVSKCRACVALTQQAGAAAPSREDASQIKPWRERLNELDAYERPYERDIEAADDEIADLRAALARAPLPAQGGVGGGAA